MKPILTFFLFFCLMVSGSAQTKEKNDCNFLAHANQADNSFYVSRLLSDNKIKKRVKVVTIPENEGNTQKQYTSLVEIQTYNDKGKVTETSWKKLPNQDDKGKEVNPLTGRSVYTYQSDTVLIEAICYSGAQDTLFEKRNYYYDDLGRLEKLNTFLKQANGTATVKFYYDKYNRVIKSISYPINGKDYPVKSSYQYNCEAKKVIHKYSGASYSDKYNYTHIYNDNNLLAEYYNKDKTEVKKFFYDAKGNIIKTVKEFLMKSDGINTQLIITSIISHNDLGLIEKIEEYEKDEITQTTRFSYEN